MMLATVFAGYDFGFFCLLAFMALVALWEYYRMLEADGIGVFTLTGLICAVVLLYCQYELAQKRPAKAAMVRKNPVAILRIGVSVTNRPRNG